MISDTSIMKGFYALAFMWMLLYYFMLGSAVTLIIKGILDARDNHAKFLKVKD